MASPCCPKCSKKHFTRSDSLPLKLSLIYCSRCGAIVGVAPMIFNPYGTGAQVTLKN